MFVDGYLALATAINGAAVTECTLPGYVRQPVAFNDPINGVTFSATPFNFGQALRAGQVGRAIYDAPTGGNLLLILPFPTPLAPARLAWDSGEQGFLRLFFTAMQTIPRCGSYTGRIAAGAVAGACSDALDVVSPADVSGRTPGITGLGYDPLIGNPRPLINAAPMTAGVALSINRGVLQAAVAVPIGVE